MPTASASVVFALGGRINTTSTSCKGSRPLVDFFLYQLVHSLMCLHDWPCCYHPLQLALAVVFPLPTRHLLNAHKRTWAHIATCTVYIYILYISISVEFTSRHLASLPGNHIYCNSYHPNPLYINCLHRSHPFQLGLGNEPACSSCSGHYRVYKEGVCNDVVEAHCYAVEIRWTESITTDCRMFCHLHTKLFCTQATKAYVCTCLKRPAISCYWFSYISAHDQFAQCMHGCV